MSTRVETEWLTCKNLQVSCKRWLTCKNFQVERLTCKNLQGKWLTCKNLQVEWLTCKFLVISVEHNSYWLIQFNIQSSTIESAWELVALFG